MNAPDTSTTWDRLRAAYETAHNAANAASDACNDAPPEQATSLVDASDAANHEEYEAWTALMKAPAPDLDAVQWKLVELFGHAGRERIADAPADAWLFGFTDVILADVERLNGGAA